jgi:hypothetical protein
MMVIKMNLSNYERIHGLWVIIGYIFAHACLEYDYKWSPWIINPEFIRIGGSTMVHNPAWLPVEWLPFILIIWVMGHMIIWAINKFR